MTRQEADTVSAIMAAMSSAVEAAWKHRDKSARDHISAALALVATMRVTQDRAA